MIIPPSPPARRIGNRFDKCTPILLLPSWLVFFCIRDDFHCIVAAILDYYYYYYYYCDSYSDSEILVAHILPTVANVVVTIVGGSPTFVRPNRYRYYRTISPPPT